MNVGGLNPCCNGRGSKTQKYGDDGKTLVRLNPCCNGRGSKTSRPTWDRSTGTTGLNPCCNGRGSKTMQQLVRAQVVES